jgi:hypothetical protein
MEKFELTINSDRPLELIKVLINATENTSGLRLIDGLILL